MTRDEENREILIGVTIFLTFAVSWFCIGDL